MDVTELADLYRKAQGVRDESVRQTLLQAVAQTAGTAEALEGARKDSNFGSGVPKGDAGTERLVELAQTELEAARATASKALGARGKSVVPPRAAEAIAAESMAAEALAAEALGAEALAAEPTQPNFAAEPFAVETSILEGTVAEGTEAIGASLRSFVDASAKR